MAWAVLVINIKGGTGKSTVARELAESLNGRGHDVGVLDADIDSANLATRLGANKRVSFSGDHIIKPVEHNGMKVYSMENAFDDSSFSQSGQFMGGVVENMINHSEWGDLDYMVVDCPPGSSDVFEELVRALRANILGAVSVGISDAVEDTARLVKVCNHNWIPILGFIENMSGIYCHGRELNCMGEEAENKFSSEGKHPVEPFGKGDIREFADNLGGNYFGDIPLCVDDTEIKDIAPETIENMVETIEDAKAPELPEDNIGDKKFIKNVWGIVRDGIKKMNERMDISQLQDKYGVEDRDPLVMKMELTDASGLGNVLSSVVLTVDNGKVRPIRARKAKRQGYSIEGGIKISSQDLHDAVRGRKKVMRSVSGEITTEPYSITDAVKMGDAEVWGNKMINRLAVLDRVLSEAVDMDELSDVVTEA